MEGSAGGPAVPARRLRVEVAEGLGPGVGGPEHQRVRQHPLEALGGAPPEALEPVVAAAPEVAPVPEFVPANEEGSTDVGRSVELAFVPAPASVVDSSASKRTALEMAAAAYVNEEDEGVPEPSASEVATAILDEKTTPPTNAMDLESPVSAAPDLEDDFRSAEPFLLSDLNPPPASPSVDDFMSGEPFLVSDVPADVPEESLLRAVVDGVEDHGGQQRSEEADPVRVTEWGEISWNEQHGALESSDLGIDAENDEVEGGAEEQSSGSELGRFGWRRTAACIVDLRQGHSRATCRFREGGP